MADASRAIVCHTLAHMRAAFAAAAELKKPLTIQTATGALRFAGAEFLLATFKKARAEFPGVEAVLVLQCDDYAADTLHAMRSGHTHFRSSAPEPTYGKLKNIAQKLGLSLLEGEVQALDLVYEYDAAKACRAWLNGA